MKGAPRILVVQTGFLGDVLLTTPLLRELRRRSPGAYLTVVATGAGAEILPGAHGVDRVIALDKRRGPGRALRTARLVARLRRERFDLAVAAHRSHRSALLVRGSGATRRVGFAGAPGRWGYTERVAWDPASHATLRYLALSSVLETVPGATEPRPAIEVLPGASRRIEGLLLDAGLAPGEPFVALAPGSVWATKRWPGTGFARLADGIDGEGLRVVLVGAPSETGLCREIAGASAARVIDLAGRTSSTELAAVLERARVVVANDNGAGHLAAAVGTPVVSIFGPTVPAMGYTPRPVRGRLVEREGLDCRPCHRHGPAACPLGHFRCMKDIPAARVLSAVLALLAPDEGEARIDQSACADVRPG